MNQTTVANVIPDRIAQALRQYPPFTMLPEESVRALAEEARVRAMATGDRAWNQGDTPTDDVLFLARGRVEYYWDNGDQTELVDVRDVGDLLGLTAIMEGAPFRVHAIVEEDSLFYVLSGGSLKKLLETNDAARYYVRRHLFWATRVGGKVSIPAEARLEGKRTILQAHLEGAQVVQPRPIERLLVCLPNDSIRKASELMVSKRVPSVLVVDGERRPLGVVTSVNLVKQVIVGGRSVEDPVRTIMASPVFAVAPNTSSTAAILLMLRERVPQVCVTEDGTTESKALDVCTHKDLLAQSGHHPAGLLREIRFARTGGRLRELCDEIERIAHSYVEAGVSGVFLGQICAELYDELTQRLVVLAREQLASGGVRLPAVAWAWMSVGSDGRREQVLRTDMDNAFIFASTGDPARDEAHRRVFLKLTERVVELLVDCGFTRCQGGVMASNPRWCKSDVEWTAEIQGYESFDPESMLRAIVLFDLRYVTGDKGICEQIRRTIFDTVGKSGLIQRRLAELVVEVPPPLNFRGKFMVEKRGGNAGEFDIKGRGLAPLRDAARAFALRYHLTRHYSTGGRWEHLATAAPKLAETAKLAYEAYDYLLRLRILTGLRRGDAGRFIEPSTLTKMERAQLSNVFDVLRMVQSAVRLEFSLEYRNR